MSMKRVKGLALMVLAVALACGSFAHTARADDCSGFNQAFAQNSASHQQDLLQSAMNASSQFPIVPAANACLNSITGMMKLLPAIADPASFAMGAVQMIINTLMTQVCSKVMQNISSVKDGLTNMTKICVPMPNFNLDLGGGGGSKIKTCDDKQPFNLVTYSTTGSTSTSFLDYLK